MEDAGRDIGRAISRRRLLALGAAVAGAPHLAWGQARRGGALKVQQVADIVSVNPYLSRAAVDRVLMDTKPRTRSAPATATSSPGPSYPTACRRSSSRPRSASATRCSSKPR